jgi:hypothetical protein
MMGKKAESNVYNNLFVLIIILAVIVVVIIGIVKFNVLGRVSDLLPIFEKENKTVVNWDEDIKIKNPELIIFEFQDGTSSTNLYYKCLNDSQWVWSKNGETWLQTNLGWGLAKLDERNYQFMFSLGGKSCEKGLELLLERTVRNDEGGWFQSTSLMVSGKGRSERVYNYDNLLLNNVNLFIRKLNEK